MVNRENFADRHFQIVGTEMRENFKLEATQTAQSLGRDTQSKIGYCMDG